MTTSALRCFVMLLAFAAPEVCSGSDGYWGNFFENMAPDDWSHNSSISKIVIGAGTENCTLLLLWQNGSAWQGFTTSPVIVGEPVPIELRNGLIYLGEA